MMRFSRQQVVDTLAEMGLEVTQRQIGNIWALWHRRVHEESAKRRVKIECLGDEFMWRSVRESIETLVGDKVEEEAK